MRLLNESTQRAIWSAAEATFARSSFAHYQGDSYTISGNYEGIFMWLTLRHLMQWSSRADYPKVGGLDMGGVSTQIAFEPGRSHSILQDAYYVSVDGSGPIRVYSHSYMRSGKEAAYQRLLQLLVDREAVDRTEAASAHATTLADPCANNGYEHMASVACTPARHGVRASSSTRSQCSRRFVGTGDYAACAALAEALLNLENECLLLPCAAQGAYQPTIGSTQLYAVCDDQLLPPCIAEAYVLDLSVSTRAWPRHARVDFGWQ